MIERYIIEIDEVGEDIHGDSLYMFYGDGHGELEEHDIDCTVEVLKNYVQHCKKQLEIAQDILQEKLNKKMNEKA